MGDRIMNGLNEINYLCKTSSIDELKDEYEMVIRDLEKLQSNLLEGSLYDIAEIDRLVKIKDSIKARLTELGE